MLVLRDIVFGDERAFGDAGFDLVVNPISTLYVPRCRKGVA